jgi:hypothetical protein
MIVRVRRWHAGVVVLRLADERFASKKEVLTHLLDQHAADLPNAFVVVTERGVRMASQRRH